MDVYLVTLPISEVEADIIGMPRLMFEKAVKKLGYLQDSPDIRQRMRELRTPIKP